ncbi:bifunctional helix-turn-helix transcriptional regulator/GNAT family N-acetyltransferase [Pseudotenacibaculum sp. MALMAid0570]|uniref:bifunctional helix-turn-helix transcriptional regulator/GNAT family N-acetyltransferase n=1 Tax=Pseudotenacibaculum sp. MALMAid0570 TaxID=3143938 RepID=UPI0032DF8B86
MDKFLELQELGFGSRMKRLSDTLMRDVKKVYKSLYIDFDPSLFPIFKTVSDEKIISIGELTQLLQISQPAVTQFVNILIKKGLIVVSADKNDKRKKLISLSESGKTLVQKLEPVWKIMQEELTALIDREPTSFMNHIRLTENRQQEKSLYERIMQRIRDKVEIIDFDSSYSNEFCDLNIEWLEAYFYVEPYDKEVLENPKTYIIDNDGHIFFAKFNDEIVGTVALINNKECYELSKMAVSPKYRGLKIGQKLMDKCIQFSTEQGWEKIKLYSNRILTPAINLYRKVGFEEVELEKDVHYERSNIKMILKL